MGILRIRAAREEGRARERRSSRKEGIDVPGVRSPARGKVDTFVSRAEKLLEAIM